MLNSRKRFSNNYSYRHINYVKLIFEILRPGPAIEVESKGLTVLIES